MEGELETGTFGVRAHRRVGTPRRQDPAGALYESIPHAVVVLGREGHVLHANSAAEHLLNTHLRDMRGRPFALGVDLPLHEAVHGQRFPLRRPGGEELVIRVDSEPALGADGTVYQVVCTLAVPGRRPALRPLAALQPRRAAGQGDADHLPGPARPRAHETFPMLLRSAIVRHPSGFMVLSSALRPEEADLITPDLVVRTLQVLGGMFTNVVFDLGVGLSDSVLSVLEMSHHVVTVSTPELTAMKDMAQFLDILADVLRLPAGRIHVVVNNPLPRSAMGLADVERILGRAVAVEFPHEGLKPEKAALAGRILALQEPNGPTARSAGALVGRMVRQVGPADRAEVAVAFGTAPLLVAEG
ncbi:MAG: PAS domain-containing protein [Chloroflexota bacterium]